MKRRNKNSKLHKFLKKKWMIKVQCLIYEFALNVFLKASFKEVWEHIKNFIDQIFDS